MIVFVSEKCSLLAVLNSYGMMWFDEISGEQGGFEIRVMMMSLKF